MKQYVKTFESFYNDYTKYNTLYESKEDFEKWYSKKSAWPKYVQSMRYALNDFKIDKSYIPEKDIIENFEKIYKPDWANITIDFIYRLCEIFKGSSDDISPFDTFAHIFSIIFMDNGLRIRFIHGTDVDFKEIWDSISNNKNATLNDVTIRIEVKNDEWKDVPLIKTIFRNNRNPVFEELEKYSIKSYFSQKFRAFTSKDSLDKSKAMFTRFFGNKLEDAQEKISFLNDSGYEIPYLDNEIKNSPSTLEWFAHGMFKEDSENSTDTAKK